MERMFTLKYSYWVVWLKKIKEFIEFDTHSKAYLGLNEIFNYTMGINCKNRTIEEIPNYEICQFEAKIDAFVEQYKFSVKMAPCCSQYDKKSTRKI